MTEKAGTKDKQTKRILWAVLGVLLVVMIGLIIAIVVLKQQECNNLEQQTQEGQTSEEAWEEEAEEGEVFAGSPDVVEGQTEPGGGNPEYAAALEQWAKDTETVEELNEQITPLSVEEAEEFLDGKLKEYADTDMEHRIMIMKIWVYDNEGQYQNALNLAQQLDENQMNDLQKVNYYRVMWAIYEDLGDSAQASRYENQWQATREKIFSGGEYLE